jgi:hypothetical protein
LLVCLSWEDSDFHWLVVMFLHFQHR